MIKYICLGILVLSVFLSPVNAKDYIIGDGDTLQISVWGSPELSLTTRVRPDGKISIPALGEIKASGLTSMELKELLQKEMTKIVKTPIVTVILVEMTNYRIFVFGKGVPSGETILTRETTLLEFLSQLGSLENADLNSAYLVRNKEKIKVNFYELFEKGDFSQDVILEPNDMIFIPDNFEKRISVVGAVANPATIPYREGLTVMDAILSAGGFTEFANQNKVEIIRKLQKEKPVSGESRALSLAVIRYQGEERVRILVRMKDVMRGDINKNMAMMPGDVIVVKESLF